MCYIHLPPIFAIHYMDNWGPLPVYLVDVVPLVLYKPIKSKLLCSFWLHRIMWIQLVWGLDTIQCFTFICHPFLPSIIWIIGASLPVYLVDVVPLVLYKPIQSKRLCSFGLQKTLWKGGNLKHKNLFHSFSSSFLLISVEPGIGCGVECAASSGPSVSTFTCFCHNMEQDKLVREKRNSVQSLSSWADTLEV